MKRFRVILKMLWPYLLAVLVAFFCYSFRDLFTDFIGFIEGVAKNALTVSSALLGFFLTIVTIISTIKTRRIQFIEDLGQMPKLYRYLHEVIWIHVIILSCTLFYPASSQFILPPKVILVTHGALFFLILLSWVLSIRFTYIFLKIMVDPK